MMMQLCGAAANQLQENSSLYLMFVLPIFLIIPWTFDNLWFVWSSQPESTRPKIYLWSVSHSVFAGFEKRLLRDFVFLLH